jgi:hypothetical protein
MRMTRTRRLSVLLTPGRLQGLIVETRGFDG